MDLEESSSKKFIKNVLKYSPSSIIPALIGFITLPFLTKLFGPSIYGNYVLAITVVSILSLIVNTLWGTSIVRFHAFYKKKEELNSFYDTLIVGILLSVILISAVFLIILQLLKSGMDPYLYTLLLIGIPLFISTALISTLEQFLVAKEKASLYSFSIVFRSLVGFIFGIILILIFESGINGLMVGYIFSYLIIIPFIYYKIFNGIFIGKSYSKDVKSKLIRYGLPLVISNLSAWILSTSDRYIINLFRGSFEVGIYSASYSISEYSLVLIWTLFKLSSYPAMVNIWENRGELETQKYISKVTRYYLLVGVPAAVGLSVLAIPIIKILTSPEYYSGFIIIPFVAFGALLLGLQWWAQIGLLLHNKTGRLATIILVSGILNLVINFILVPQYGYIGAAISTLVSYFVLLAL